MIRISLSIAIISLFSLSCESPTRQGSRGAGGYSQTGFGFFRPVKTKSIADIDPLAARARGEIDVEGGKGYYATFQDPKEIAAEYSALAQSLRSSTQSDLVDKRIIDLRDGLLKKLELSITELGKQTQPVMRFYAPMLSLSQNVGTTSKTEITLGPTIFHVNLGIETENIGTELFPLADLDKAEDRLSQALLWCSNKACQVGNFFTTQKRIMGLKGGLNVGNSMVAKGTVAISWKRGTDALGMLSAGETTLEMGMTAVGGLASYMAYVELVDGKPALRLPAGINLSVNYQDLLQQAFQAILTAHLDEPANEIGGKADMLQESQDYYLGMRKNGTLGAVPADPSMATKKHGFWEGRVGVQPLGKDKLIVLGNNRDCK